MKLELLRLFFEGSIFQNLNHLQVLLMLFKFPIPGSALLTVRVIVAVAAL